MRAMRHGLACAQPERRETRVSFGRRFVPSSCRLNYGPDSNPLVAQDGKDRGRYRLWRSARLSRVIKPRLKTLARWLLAQAGGDVKVFVDPAALMEKPLAGAAGLGWQGKHTNPCVARTRLLVSRRILTTLDLPSDVLGGITAARAAPALMHVRRMHFSAPTNSDARRCISYSQSSTKARSRMNSEPRSATASIGCDDVSCGLPVEQVRAGRRETQTRSTRGC